MRLQQQRCNNGVFVRPVISPGINTSEYHLSKKTRQSCGPDQTTAASKDDAASPPSICYGSDRCYTSVVPKEELRRLYSAETEPLLGRACLSADSVQRARPRLRKGSVSQATLTPFALQTRRSRRKA